MTHHQPVCSRHIAETAPGEATTEDHPNPRLRKEFKARNTRNTRKNGTLPRISRIPRSSRLSILATCLNPQHFAPSCRGQPPLGEDSGTTWVQQVQPLAYRPAWRGLPRADSVLATSFELRREQSHCSFLLTLWGLVSPLNKPIPA